MRGSCLVSFQTFFVVLPTKACYLLTFSILFSPLTSRFCSFVRAVYFFSVIVQRICHRSCFHMFLDCFILAVPALLIVLWVTVWLVVGMSLIRIQELFGLLLIHACLDHSLGTRVCGGAAGLAQRWQVHTLKFEFRLDLLSKTELFILLVFLSHPTSTPPFSLYSSHYASFDSNASPVLPVPLYYLPFPRCEKK